MELNKNQFTLSQKMLQAASNFNSAFCPNISKYERLAKIGQGTFGEVFKARNRTTQQFVALKKVLMANETEGFPITALREIKILQHLKHENIVNLIEVCQSVEINSKNKFQMPSFYLVFDFCEHDLAGLLSASVKFSLGEMKMIMKQLLNGLFFMHANKILHRPCRMDQPNRLTNRVITLWYRPPEVLLGERNYGPAIDIWGAGCIMAELWTKTPILQGATEQHQLKLISELCGSITPESLPGVEKLDLYRKVVLPRGLKRRLTERLKICIHDEYALQLLDQLLTIDPLQRVDADKALTHDFFYSDPLPCAITGLAGLSKSQFEFHRRQKNNPPVQPRRNDGQYYDPVY